MTKKEKIFYGFIVLVLFFTTVAVIRSLTKGNVIEEEIAESYRGIITDIYAPRKTPPTHVRIETQDGIKSISVTPESIQILQVGDSIIKKPGSKYFITKKSNGEILHLPIFNDLVMKKY